MKKQLIDITLQLDDSNTPVWPNERAFLREEIKSYSSNGVCVSSFSMGTHLGTHIDSPSHFIEGGKQIGDYSLEKLVGDCLIINLSNIDFNSSVNSSVDSSVNQTRQIKSNQLKKFEHLLKHETFCRRLLIKTSNSKILQKEFTKDFVSLSSEAAEYLSKFPLDLIGFDYLSIEAHGASKVGAPVHKLLLSKNIAILEGINLNGVDIDEYGCYSLICLPLKVSKIEAIPVRAILMV